MAKLYNPQPCMQVASTDLRRDMAKTFQHINTNRSAAVVTVANCPKIVIADFTAYNELLYRAQQ